MRWPPFFSLNSVNSTRSSGGRYSLMFVAMMRFTPRLALNFLQPRVERRERDDELDAGGLEGLAKLAGGVERIERKHRGARFPRAELGNQELRAVRQQQRDAIAFPDAGGHERRGEPVAQAIELGVRKRGALEKDRGRIGPRSRGSRM